MNKKKILSQVIVASVLMGVINFLPVPNFDAGNFQVAVAYAESKNFAAKEAAMTDVEIIETQAKEASRMRAIESVKEKIASYVRNFSGAKGKLSEDDIAAIAEKFEEVGEAKYKKLFYNAVDEEGKELGKVGIMYEATVTAKFNSKKITEYIKLTEQEKERRIRQARESREHFKELDREYEELRKNARTKTPEQLQSDIKIFDDKISDLEKNRGKNKSSNKKTTTTKPKDKSKITENKTATPVSNVPMQFSQVVKIGGLFVTPSSGTVIEKADYISSQPVNMFDGKKTYGNFTSRWGDETNGIYCHFNNYPPKFGGKNDSIAVDMGPFASIERIQNSKNMPLYMIILGNYDVRYTEFYLIGKRPDGRWVKYFDTKTIKQSYPLPERVYLSNKCSVRDDTVIIPCEQLQGRNQVAVGEFRFKWDEAAKWFGVEKIISQQAIQDPKMQEAQRYYELAENEWKNIRNHKYHYEQNVVANYTRAIELNPNFTDAYISRSVVYYERGMTNYPEDIVKAKSDVNRALEINPKSARAYRWRAYINQRIDTNKALEDVNKAIVIDPQYLDAYETRAWIYEVNKEYSKAIADLTTILNSKNLRNSFMQHHDFEWVATNETFTSFNNKLSWIYSRRGQIYKNMKNYDMAISDYRKALELTPNDYFLKDRLNRLIEENNKH